jgi:hypothetical protein
LRIYDDIFAWEGWGGRLKLGHGRCHLRIFDLRQLGQGGASPLRPFVVIVHDVPDSPMSVRSCAGHIATVVTERFKIDPGRMQYVEYYPESRYGAAGEHLLPERFDAADFSWQEGKALFPRWRTLQPALAETLKALIGEQ